MVQLPIEFLFLIVSPPIGLNGFKDLKDNFLNKVYYLVSLSLDGKSSTTFVLATKSLEKKVSRQEVIRSLQGV